MGTDEFDLQIEGQMSIEDLFEPPERLFAVSRIFARARKKMSLEEQQTFVYALSELRFTEEPKNCVVYLNKKTLAKILKLKSDTNHLSRVIFSNIKGLTTNSYIEIADEDKENFASGYVISSVIISRKLRNVVKIRFNEDYIKLFTGLTTDYITMWSADIFQMTSKRSVQFYELLRQLTDTRFDVNQHGWGVKQLKEIFGIPKEGKGSYMRKDGHFDRPAFEKYVIQPICEDLKNCKMINLVLQPDPKDGKKTKPYEKVKVGNRVVGYRFYWVFSSHPGVATATEVHEIQQRVDKNPKVLKITKNILDGEKRQYQPDGSVAGTKARQKTNQFTQMQNNEYDFEALEAELTARPYDDEDALPFH